MEAVNALSGPAIKELQRIAYFVDNVLPKVVSRQERRRIYDEAKAVIEEAKTFSTTPMSRRAVRQKRRIIEERINDFIVRNMKR